jgi:hypothetical protein
MHALSMAAGDSAWQLHWGNCLASFVGPWYGMWYLQTDPGGGMIALVFAATAFMKITSFILMCQQLRAEYASKDQVYKATLGQWLYFIAAPTLVYKDKYPRTARVRMGWLGRRVAEFIGTHSEKPLFRLLYIVFVLKSTQEQVRKGWLGGESSRRVHPHALRKSTLIQMVSFTHVHV